MIIVKTKRLTVGVSSDEEIRTLIEAADEELRVAYREMAAGADAHPTERHWYAPWIIRLSGGEAVGELCFRGLSPDGMLEIGYGIDDGYRGRGYAAEAVAAVTEWAARQPGVSRIEAETAPDNAASQRVLTKAGFVPLGVLGEEGPRFVWRDPQ